MFGYEAFAQAPFAALAGGSTFNVDIAEDGVSTSDVLTRIATYVRTQAEGAEIASSIGKTVLFLADVAEGADVVEEYTRSVNFVAVQAEGTDLVETLTNLREANVYPVGIQIDVLLGFALVWGIIDDRQNANWQNVDNSVGTGWVEINNGQTPGWNQIPS